MSRALIIDDAVKARVRAQAEWADQQANWYRADQDKEPPGDNPAYVLHLEMGFRCVYSHTVMKGEHFRHLSISVDGPKFPHPAAFSTIASWFGFTGGIQEGEAVLGPGPDWMIDVSEKEHCVVVAQRIGGAS